MSRNNDVQSFYVKIALIKIIRTYFFNLVLSQYRYQLHD